MREENGAVGCGLQSELVVGHHIIPGKDKSVTDRMPLKIQEKFPGCSGKYGRQNDYSRLVGRTVYVLCTVGEHFPVLIHNPPVEPVFVEIGKVKPVFHLYGYLLPGRDKLGLDVLIDLLHFLEMRMRCTVGRYQTVAAEVAEAGDILRTVVAAVAPVPVSVLVNLTERLVHPVPDASALQDGFFLYQVPVFLHAAAAVAHGMEILTHNVGARGVRPLCIGLHVAQRTVHRTVYVRIEILFSTFILHRPCRVRPLQPAVGVFEVRTVAGLVAQRPNDDARVILGTPVHTLRPVHVAESQVLSFASDSFP